MISSIEIIFRLILSTIIGSLIGIEREFKNRPAGLRTHVLVTLGSTLIMLISIDGFKDLGGTYDLARIAAQVVSGIGFLGAGTIMVRKNRVDGLTTAASLWVSAGIGLGVGVGYYLASVVTGAIVLLTLKSLKIFEKRFLEGRFKTVEVSFTNRPGIIGQMGVLFGNYNMSIKDILIVGDDYEEDDDIMEIKFIIRTPNAFDTYNFYSEFFSINGIRSLVFDGVEINNDNNRELASVLSKKKKD